MSSIDRIGKKFAADNYRFADIFNNYIYQGKPIISASDLKPAEIEELVLPSRKGRKEQIQRYRDIMKIWAAKQDGNAVYILLGMELQNNIHYAMPAKTMLYDAANYIKQVEEKASANRQKDAESLKNSDEFLSGFRKEDKLIPVITLVLYLHEDPWDGPLSLHEMFGEYDRCILDLVPDYRMNLISPNMLSDEDIDKFSPDVDAVMRFIKYSKDKEKLLEKFEHNPRYESIAYQSVDLINAVTGAGLKYKKKGDKVDMCTAIEELRTEERQFGIMQGIEQGFEQGIDQGIGIGQLRTLKNLTEKKIITVEQAAEEAGMSVEEFLEKMMVS